MPRTLDELVTLLDLEEIEETLFRGRHPATVLQRAFGGQVLAQAMRAAQRTVPEGRVLHSMHAYFLRPGRTDHPIIYDVGRTRDGRTFSSRRVVARQGGESIFTLSASFHALEPGLHHADAMPEGQPGPDECPPLSEVMSQRFPDAPQLWKEWDVLDVRYVGDSRPSGAITPSSHTAHMRVWVKVPGSLPDDPSLHQALLAYLSDLTLLSVTTVPHPVVFMSSQVQASSIDHAMWFHRPARADEWLLYDQISPSAQSALGFATGRLFQHGTLVASCAQEGLVRVVE